MKVSAPKCSVQSCLTNEPESDHHCESCRKFLRHRDDQVALYKRAFKDAGKTPPPIVYEESESV